MKNTIIRSLTALGVSLMMALSVAAQDEPKIKTNEKEMKYKSEDLKIKDKKDESKYKSDDLKMKDKKDESKYKSDEMKIKDKKDERKVKAKVKPMQRTKTVRTELKTGETNVKVQEHIERVTVEPPPPTPAPVVVQKVTAPELPPVKKPVTRKYVARKKTPTTATVARKANTAPKPKYIVRTKLVRDTVYVPSPPERVVATEYVYVHDTVTVTRVDTVVKVQTENTYTGYRVPRGDFKKVKLKRDKDDGGVWMKRKEKDKKTKDWDK